MEGAGGFTLIEALVAMSVLAVGAVGLLGAVERHVRLSTELADRAVARWVAENRMAALRLGIEAPDGPRLLGQEFTLEQSLSDTPQPGLARIDLRVGTTDGTAVTLTGFVPRGPS